MVSLAKEAVRLGAYIGCYTLMSRSSTAHDLTIVRPVLDSYNELSCPQSIAPERRSGSSLGPKIYVALGCLAFFGQFWVSREIALEVTGNFTKRFLKVSVEKCYSPKVAVVASLCFAFYAGVKHYSLDKTRPWSYVANIAEAIGQGALVGTVSHYSPVLGLASLLPLYLVNYSRREKVRDDRAICTIAFEGCQVKSIKVFLEQQKKSIKFAFSECVGAGDDEDVKFVKEIKVGSGTLSKASFEALIPMSGSEVKTTTFTNDERDNLAFLRTGLRLLSKMDIPNEKERNEYWLTRFAQLLNDPSTSTQARRQLAIDYCRS